MRFSPVYPPSVLTAPAAATTHSHVLVAHIPDTKQAPPRENASKHWQVAKRVRGIMSRRFHALTDKIFHDIMCLPLSIRMRSTTICDASHSAVTRGQEISENAAITFGVLPQMPPKRFWRENT